MRTVTSKDGTPIAFDESGEGPPIILVVGAFNERSTGAPLAATFSEHFTVFNYDRRGRGASGDTAPYTIERELEDLDVLITEAGIGIRVRLFLRCYPGLNSGGSQPLHHEAGHVRSAIPGRCGKFPIVQGSGRAACRVDRVPASRRDSRTLPNESPGHANSCCGPVATVTLLARARRHCTHPRL